jgi:hypothetical protein
VTFREYQLETRRTANGDYDRTYDLANYALGLVDESIEMECAGSCELLDECSDVLWYAARIADVCGLDFDAVHELSKTQVNYEPPMMLAMRIGEMSKKVMFQGHPLDREKMMEYLSSLLGELSETLEGYYDWSLEAAIEHNVAKLRKRYPDGFEATRSINKTN